MKLIDIFRLFVDNRMSVFGKKQLSADRSKHDIQHHVCRRNADFFHIDSGLQ